MTKDEAREVAWYQKGMNLVQNEASRDRCFRRGFDSGYDFAKSEDRAVIDGFLARVREMAEEETKQLDVDDVQTYRRFYNAMMRVHAEMFEETE